MEFTFDFSVHEVGVEVYVALFFILRERTDGEVAQEIRIFRRLHVQAVDSDTSHHVVKRVASEVCPDACRKFRVRILVAESQRVWAEVVNAGRQVEFRDCLDRIELSVDG